uniref:Uncharacterized protein n=1 Tax=Acrobeloides nanus TaxID=290746 RepID=A0A914C727_9BILA
MEGNGFTSNDIENACGYSFTLTCTPGTTSGNNCVYIGNANGVIIPGSQMICSGANINIVGMCNVDTTLCSTADLTFCTTNPMPGFYSVTINGVTYRLNNNNNVVCDQR